MANMRRANLREMMRAVAVLAVDPDGELPLPEPAVDRLNAADGWWVISAQKQIMLTPVARARAPKAEIRDGRLLLPDAVMQKLEATTGALIALIERWDDKLVLKRVDPAVVKQAEMRRGEVPQVLAITRCSKDGRFVLKGNVREKLGSPPYFLTTAGEVCISQEAGEGRAPFPLVKNRGTLPAAVLAQLGITAACRVALLQREDGVAVKRLELEQRAGASPRSTMSRPRTWSHVWPRPTPSRMQCWRDSRKLLAPFGCARRSVDLYRAANPWMPG